MPHHQSILIIDDNLDDREYYIRSLKKASGSNTYEYQEAQDGQKGVQAAIEGHFDCVLLDYSLPGMNGLEVLKRLHEQQPYLPVVLLTGQGNETVAVEAIKEGAHDYLAKSSVNAERLHQTVSSAIAQSAMRRNIAEKDTQIREKTEALEKSVKELEAARQEQDKLITKLLESNSELERFAYICSHDLQEPLRMIHCFTQRLQKHLNGQLDEKGQHYMKYITDGAEHARRLINDVLNYARADNHSELLTDVPSDTILISVLNDLRSRIEETGACITHDPLPMLHIQPIHLRQILQNLISNALKFCADTPQIHISATQEGAFWRFHVKDNGIGIATEHVHKIFSIFQRLHSNDLYPGTGIGLALCKKITCRYGGNIWVESTPGKGSSFFFTLPATTAAASEAA